MSFTTTTDTRMDRLCGTATVAGGLFAIVVNAGLTPFIQLDAPYAVTAASPLFLWRQSISAFVAVLLLIGSVGLYSRQAGGAGRFGTIAFVLAFLGSALLLANEWSQVFFVRTLALNAPEVLDALESPGEISPFDVGALVALGVFTLGWIAFAISMLQAGAYSRRGPILLIGGFFAVPIFTPIFPGLWGAVIGNVILGSGWIVLGSELARSEGREARAGGSDGP